MDTLEIDDDEVFPEASLVNDLGAASIDYLDISFRTESDFGVPIPVRELGERRDIIRKIAMQNISDYFAEKHNRSLKEDETQRLAQLGVTDIVSEICLAE